MNIPVLVGISHVEQRISDWSEGKEPLDLMVDAVRDALSDTGVDLVPQVDAIHVIGGLWQYKNPAAHIAQQIGAQNVENGLTTLGGNCLLYTSPSPRD